jgi:hypothetical protein
MIEQVPGHRSYKWFLKEENHSCPILIFAYTPNFPLVTQVIDREYEERVRTRGNTASYHWPEVIRTLPKPNNSVPAFESSPHVWHFKDTETDIEFLMFSDGRRKNHYKGTSVEVICDANGHHKQDAMLAAAYSRLLEFVEQCYNLAQQNNS